MMPNTMNQWTPLPQIFAETTFKEVAALERCREDEDMEAATVFKPTTMDNIAEPQVQIIMQ